MRWGLENYRRAKMRTAGYAILLLAALVSNPAAASGWGGGWGHGGWRHGGWGHRGGFGIGFGFPAFGFTEHPPIIIRLHT